MKDRIKKIMESENMTPARFADHLQIGRAVISHILNGRNNPSLDVITRILSQMPNLNSDWLLTGLGNMYKNEKSNSDREQKNQTSIPDLFSPISKNDENVVYPSKDAENLKYRKENVDEISPKEAKEIVTERVAYKGTSTKKVKQIIIYYNDNTFESFCPGH